MAFDTEKPPAVHWGPIVTPSSAARIEGISVGPDIVLDFTGNPEAAQPFFEWLSKGEAWFHFGTWYDGR